MAAPTTVITIIKDFTYRGVPGEEWSNTYMFTGATPADSTAWRALFDAVIFTEKTCYVPATRITRGYGYDKVPVKGDHAVWSVDLRPSATTVPGTLSAASATAFAGDQAAWLRWSLDRFTSKGKRVYLRKYYHGGMTITATPDTLAANLVTNLNAHGTKMMDGTLISSRKICDAFGNVPIASVSGSFVTTRTLKRRSKRPPA